MAALVAAMFAFKPRAAAPIGPFLRLNASGLFRDP
jgi:hypothetical protein